MTEPVGAGFSVPRGFLRVGGVAVVRHQLGVAQALDCQRLVCIARTVGAEAIALQHDAEAAGIQFHVIPDSRGLARLVTAADDVIVLADGLLADPAVATGLLGDRERVLVQPVEAGLAAGFERIDAHQASAGALRIPGRLVDGLANLPADCDVPSALTRIALQAGIPISEVPADIRTSPRWRLVRDEAEARSLEDDWLRFHVGFQLSASPGSWLARNLVKLVGPTLLHAGHGSRWLFGSSALLLLVAALAAVLAMSGDMLRRIEGGVSPRPLAATSPLVAFVGVLDAALAWLAVQEQPLLAWQSTTDRAFPAIMLALVARLLARALPANLAAWAEDRSWLLLLLAGFAGFGLLAPALQLLAIVAALVGIVLGGGFARLTRS